MRLQASHRPMRFVLILVVASLILVTCSDKSTQPEDNVPPDTSNPAIAFSSSRDANYEIYVMDADGSHQTNLTNDPGNDYYPVWSPDGTMIAFESDRINGQSDIFVMNADGSGLKRLTYDYGGDHAPQWSPGSTILTYHGWRGDNYEIFTVDVENVINRRLTFSAENDMLPHYSPTGLKIVFQTERNGMCDIYSMDPNGSNQKLLTDIMTWDYNPSISNDGSKIAFLRPEFNFVDTVYTGNLCRLYTMNIDGSNKMELTRNACDFMTSVTNSSEARWSPDDSKLLFTASEDVYRSVASVNADGTNEVRLTEWGFGLLPAWSRDASQILYRRGNPPNCRIGIMDADGSNAVYLTTYGADNVHPSWKPRR